MKMIRLLAAPFATLALLALAMGPVLAQPQDNNTLGALITNTAASAATTSKVGPRNTGAKGVVCTFNQTAETGSATTTFSVDFEDSASGTWQALATSGNIINLNSPTTVTVYPGAVASAVPSRMVIAGLRLPVIWRVTQNIAGGGTTTGTLGCDLLN